MQFACGMDMTSGVRGGLVGRVMAPADVHSPIPGACEYIAWQRGLGRRSHFKDLEMGVSLDSQGVRSNHMGP